MKTVKSKPNYMDLIGFFFYKNNSFQNTLKNHFASSLIHKIIVHWICPEKEYELKIIIVFHNTYVYKYVICKNKKDVFHYVHSVLLIKNMMKMKPTQKEY